jgi:hypothetical protein
MISLASSPTHTRISPEPAESRPARTDSGRQDSGFSAVLAQHEPQKTQVQGKPAQAAHADAADPAPEAEPALALAPNGSAMPEAAKAGKSLPVALPGRTDQADGEDTTDDSDEAVAHVAAEAILAMASVPQAAPPAAPVTAEADADAQAQAAGGGRARPMPYPSLPAQAPKAAAGEPQATGEKPGGATVALQVAPQPAAQSGETAMDTQTDSDAPAARPRGAAIERTAAQPATADAARPADFASVTTPAAAAPTPAATVSASGEVRPAMQANALHDLTRIVDRLAAAREVFAPATEALAINHAEFGELSLRFDQRRDGLLSVQLAASNPEAHRAVAQAVGAQTFHSAADGQPQNQPQNQSQAQAQMGARAGTGERDGSHGAARHGEPQPEQPRQPTPQVAPADARQPAGIFA